MTGAIKGSPTKKFYLQQGLEPIQSRRWLQKLFVFYKNVEEKFQIYLFELTPSNSNSYQARIYKNFLIPQFKERISIS